MIEALYPATPENEASRKAALDLLSAGKPSALIERLTPICWLKGEAALALHIGQVPGLNARMGAIYTNADTDSETFNQLVNHAADLLEPTLGREAENTLHGFVLNDQRPGPHKATLPGSSLNIYGLSSTGAALRTRWFTHPDAKEPPALEGQIASIWRKPEAKDAEAAIAMWEAENALPQNVSAAERAKDLVCMILREGKAIGVATATIERFAPLNTRMAVLRVFVADAARGSMVKTHLCLGAFDILEKWAKAQPEEGVTALLMVMQNARAHERYHDMPRPTRTVKAERIGFDANGKIITIRWFENAVIATP